MPLNKGKQNLDHQVWKLLKEASLQEKSILVALSGGADSVALLSTLVKTHPGKVFACYFHHGDGANLVYRDQARLFCESLCHDLDVPFFSLKSESPASSEADYRVQRYAAFEKLMLQKSLEVLATGHHRDDLLETRLLRLIRGSGGQGLQAMSIYEAPIFRPFLQTQKKELLQYLQVEELGFAEDPTNTDLDPLRNWIRGSWLPQLEERSAGANDVLARSLETMAFELQQTQNDLLLQNEAYKTQGLQRSFYLTLSHREQKRLLAQYLFSLGKRDFSQSHLEEIQKRLDNSQKVITFRSAGCEWLINAQQIKVQS